MSSFSLNMTRARRKTGVRDQAGKAASADAIAACTSASVDITTRAHSSPVAESWTSPYRSDDDSWILPSTQLPTLRTAPTASA